MATFVVHSVIVTIYPLDEEDDGYESDVAQLDEEEYEEGWDEEWEQSLVKRKFNDDNEDVIKKVKTY